MTNILGLQRDCKSCKTKNTKCPDSEQNKVKELPHGCPIKDTHSAPQGNTWSRDCVASRKRDWTQGWPIHPRGKFSKLIRWKISIALTEERVGILSFTIPFYVEWVSRIIKIENHRSLINQHYQSVFYLITLLCIPFDYTFGYLQDYTINV